MKKSALLLLLIINTSLLFAQKTDTVKRWVDGAMIKSTGDVFESASRINRLSKFTALLSYSGLTDTLRNRTPVTIFAPDNKALTNIAIYDSLEKATNKSQLSNLLKYYIVPGKITSKDILKFIRKNNGQAVLTTLSGSTLTATIDINRNIVLTDMNGSSSIISKFDIRQQNGILHIITAPLFPLKPPH
jgi:uncharacterized surface protein with fasciclin (FAS1) repeats